MDKEWRVHQGTGRSSESWNGDVNPGMERSCVPKNGEISFRKCVKHMDREMEGTTWTKKWRDHVDHKRKTMLIIEWRVYLNQEDGRQH
jgi:hypothetical protein